MAQSDDTTIGAVEGDDEAAITAAVTADLEAVVAADVAKLMKKKAKKIPPHALDIAPINSKIVVVRGPEGIVAVLAKPDGIEKLPHGDPAHQLPDGARIRKTRDDEYIAEQLSPTIEYPPLVTTTAGEAIQGFLARFHPTD